MAASIGIANKNYVSTIKLLDKREINPLSLDIYNEEGLTDIMGVAGRYKPTQMTSYHHFVNDPLFVQGEVDATPVTGAGTKASPLVITLTAATSRFARKTDAIKFKNGQVGYVKHVDRSGAKDVITVEPVNRSVALATPAAGDKLSFFTNAVGEKSGAVENRRYSMTKYTGLIQAFREVNEESDIQTMSAIEVTFGGKAHYHVKNLADKFLMHKASVNAAMIGGSMSVKADGTESEFGTDSAEALIDPINGGSTQFTRGLDEWITLLGVNDSTDTPDVIDNDDFEDVIQRLLAKKSPKSFIGHAGTKVRMKIDKHFKGLGSSGMERGFLSLDGKKFDFGVDEITLGGFKFQFINLPILDNEELFGNSDISKSLYLVPTDKVKVKGGGMEPRLQIRYMRHNIAKNQGNDIWAEWHTGALAPTGATDDELIWRTNWVTYQGLEVLGAQHFARVKVLA